MRIPSSSKWKDWNYPEYIRYFLSKRAAKRRLKGKSFPLDILSKNQMKRFCRPIKNKIEKKFRNKRPKISITIAAHNEEMQILPTIISYTLLKCREGLAELIIVDNSSKDRTAEIARSCGVKIVECRKKGLHYARKAGLDSAYEDAEYIWMSDADVRMVPPVKKEKNLKRKGTPLETSYAYLEKNSNTAGVSSGALVESAHWLYNITHNLALVLNMTNEYSCWSGPNQFMRKWALEESGGINLEMGSSSEDHIRHYQLARWAKKNNMELSSANTNKNLEDPVYHSGRRVGSAKKVIKSIWTSINRSNVKEGNHWSEKRHTGDSWWEEMK